MASTARVFAGLALTVAALATPLSISVSRVTTTVEGVAACALGALIGAAQALEIAPGAQRGSATGFCATAQFGPEVMQLLKAASAGQGEGESAVAATTTAGGNDAAASFAGGGCSAAVSAPVDRVVFAVANGVSADDSDQTDASESGEVRDLNDLVERSQRAPEPESEADTTAMRSGDAPPKSGVAPTPRKRAKPIVVPDEAKKAWWPANQSGKLNLNYAGQASFGAAIVLLFDGTFETSDSANQNIQVKTRDGQAVNGQWVLATNRQMLLFSARPGVYSVNVGAGLTDKGGRSIAAPSTGLVAVQ